MTAWLRQHLAGPLAVFALVLGLAFGIEALIMMGLDAMGPVRNGAWVGAFIDAAVLTVLLAPALWLLVVRPLQRHARERGALLGQVFNAQEAERARLAKELHDELGQHLTGALLTLRAAGHCSNAEEARQRVALGAAAVADALDATRALARGLAPAALADHGLVVAVRRLAEQASARSGVPIDVHATPAADGANEGGRDGPAELCGYRVVQEAVTNALRHARPTRVRVDVDRTANGWRLAVHDDGCGLDAGGDGRPGFGLASLRERVAHAGGHLSLRSRPGAGTQLTVTIPTAAHPAAAVGPAGAPIEQSGGMNLAGQGG